MAKQSKSSSKERWFTRPEMAALWCVTPTHFDRHHRKHISDFNIRTTRGGRVRVEFAPAANREIHEAFLDQVRIDQKDDAGRPIDEGDAAETRMKIARAQLAELELAKELRTVIAIDVAERILMTTASVIRETARRLGQAYGKQAKAELEDALKRATQKFEKELDRESI